MISVDLCVCACLCVHVTVLAGNGHKLKESVRTGGEVKVEVAGAGWEVDREMTRRKEKRWAPFHDGRTHQSISPGLLQGRVPWMAPPETVAQTQQN